MIITPWSNAISLDENEIRKRAVFQKIYYFKVLQSIKDSSKGIQIKLIDETKGVLFQLPEHRWKV